MDDAHGLFVAGQRAFADRVHAVGTQQWSVDTPCAQWTVADLVRHLVDEHRWAAPLARGSSLVSARPDAFVVRDDLVHEWDDAARRSAAAFAEDGALDRTVDLSRGPAPARAYLAELTVDLVVHAWDLGRAIGYTAALPDDLVSDVRPSVDDAVAPYGTMFSTAVDVPDGSSVLDRLIARTGRDPNWSAS